MICVSFTFPGRVPSLHWGVVAACQSICLHVVQLASGKTEILQEAREEDVAWRGETMQRRAHGESHIIQGFAINNFRYWERDKINIKTGYIKIRVTVDLLRVMLTSLACRDHIRFSFTHAPKNGMASIWFVSNSWLYLFTDLYQLRRIRKGLMKEEVNECSNISFDKSLGRLLVVRGSRYIVSLIRCR